MHFSVVLLFMIIYRYEALLVEPFTFDISEVSTSNVLIGKAYTNDTNKTYNFYLRQVLERNGDLLKENDNKHNIKSWESVALNETKNDCKDETLKNYKGPRKSFCIDHKTGEIFTTKYISDQKLEVGKGFDLEVMVGNGKIAEGRKWYKVNIAERCSYLTDKYNLAKKCLNFAEPQQVICKPNDTVIDLWTCHNITLKKPYYAVGFKVVITRTFSILHLRFGLEGYNHDKSIRVLKTPYESTSLFSNVAKLYNNTNFIFRGWNDLKQVLEGNIIINQLIIHDNYETCQNIGICSEMVNQIPNDPRCENLDADFLKRQENWCKAKLLVVVSDKNVILKLPIKSTSEVVHNTSYAEMRHSLKYTILSVEGPTNNAQNVTYPQKCIPSSESNDSDRYFCINENTGNIYTTIDWDLTTKPTSFTITVRVMDTSFPTTYSVSKVILVTRNDCYQLNRLYSIMRDSRCDLKISRMVPSDVISGRYLSFNTTIDYNSIFAAEISIENTFSTNKSYIMTIELNDEIFNKSFTLMSNVTKDLIPLQFNQVTQTFRNINRSFGIKIYLNQKEDNGKTTPYVLAKNSVTLIYTRNWSKCANDDCLKLYKNWKADVMQSNDTRKCIMKPLHAFHQDLYYRACSDTQPKFITGPQLVNDTIQGCDYASTIAFHNRLYWVVNGTKNISGSSMAATTSEGNVFKFFTLSIKNLTRDVTYQCAIYDPSRMTKTIYSYELFLYSEINPTFTTGPSLNGTTMEGCAYKSSVPLYQYAYWLLNGTVAVNGTSTETLGNYGNSSMFSFPQLKLSHFSPGTSYQCGIYYPERMRHQLLSEPFYTDFVVNFLDGPKRNGTKLQGCSYNANTSLDTYSYWLIDSSTLVKGTRSNYFNRKAPVGVYNFAELEIIDYPRGSAYQCFLYHPERMKTAVVSKKILPDIRDIVPTFTVGPYLNGTSLRGCTYKANISLRGYAYWFANGTTRMNGTAIKSSVSGNDEEYDFPELSILDYHPSTFYQCILYHPKRMKKLVKSVTIIPDIRNIDPIFVTPPQLNGSTLVGCSYKADITLNTYTFWLINGSTVKLKITSEPLRSIEKNLYLFPELYLSDFQAGVLYQCGIYDPRRMKNPKLSTEIYTDILPSFVDGPKWNGSVLHGCDYQSNLPLDQYAFWLVDNKASNNEKYIKPLQNQSNYYHFPKLTVDDFTPGITYQCGLYHPKRMTNALLSKAIILKFPDAFTISGPTLLDKSAKSDARLNIEGCTFYSQFPLSKMTAFWIKNGVSKTVINTTDFIKVEGNYTYQMRALQYDKGTYEQQGFYQCGLSVNGRPDIISEKLDIQFTDVSDTRLLMVLHEKWSASYVNKSSMDYQNLERNLTTKIKKMAANLPFSLVERRFIHIVSIRMVSLKRDMIEVQAKIIYINVNEKERVQTCLYVHKYVHDKKYGSLHVVNAQNYDCCFAHSIGTDEYKGEYHFNTTLVMKTVTVKCKYGENILTRECVPNLYYGPSWSKMNIEKCQKRPGVREALKKITQKTICSTVNDMNCVSAQEAANDLRDILVEARSLKSSTQMELVSDIISDLTANIDSINTTADAQKFLGHVLTSVDVVLSSPEEVIIDSQQKGLSSTKFLQNLEKMAKRLGNLINGTNNSIAISRPNVGVNIAFIEAQNLAVGFSKSKDNIGVTFSSASNQSKSETQLIIPNEAFKSKKELIYSYTYSSNVLFKSSRNVFQSPAANKSFGRQKREIDGQVVSASIGESKVENLINPIVLKFIKSKTWKGYERSCQFWDFNISEYGDWSNEGCKFVKEDESFVYCECDHLTNFALLLDVSQSGHNPIELKLITWIGCGFSLAGLTLTIITYISLSKLRAKLAPKLLICLCISLMLLLLTFLIGAERTDNRVACQVVAILLQFFTLTTFSWMAVEAYNLYRCFVKIFKSNTTDTKFLLKSSLLVYGIPALVSTITATVAPDKLGNENICVLHGFPFFIGILLPVSLIILGNFFALYLVITGIDKTSKTRSESKRNRRQRVHRTRIAFTCSVLLGLTWIFGVLAFGDLAEVFQWLFCICNSLQGFFIFVFYTIKNKDVWNEWKKALGLIPDTSFNNSTLSRTKNWSKKELYATSSNRTRSRSNTMSSRLSRPPSNVMDDDSTESKLKINDGKNYDEKRTSAM